MLAEPSVLCDSIDMNNILFIGICLSAIAASVYSLTPAAQSNRHVAETENKMNSWSRTITRQRRDAGPKGGPRHDPLYVFKLV